MELETLLYVTSLRKSNFQLYVSAFARFVCGSLPWIIINVLRSVRFIHLSNLELTALSLYEEFNTDKFSFKKL